MFGEPAWDILLALYVNEPGQRQTISRLAETANASKSTALRWLEHLERHGLVRREDHPHDRRTVFVELTDAGRGKLDFYFAILLSPER